MSAPQSTSFRAMLARVTWIFFGPMLLVVAAGAIATKSKSLFSFADGAYFFVLGAMLVGRWAEFRDGEPRTATGEPATRQDLRRYALAVSCIGLLVWGGATLYRTVWLNS